MRRRILHLLGSPTSAFWSGLSLVYGRGALGALSEEHEFVNAVVLPDGKWRFVTDLDPRTIRDGSAYPLGSALQMIAGMDVDCALPQMFCQRGMTAYRALLEELGLPLH